MNPKTAYLVKDGLHNLGCGLILQPLLGALLSPILWVLAAALDLVPLTWRGLFICWIVVSAVLYAHCVYWVIATRRKLYLALLDAERKQRLEATTGSDTGSEPTSG